MSSAKKAASVSRPIVKSRKVAHADYSDEISPRKLAEIQELASSKDRDGERWTRKDGPAW